MAYFTNLFTVKTWEQFLAAGGQISGFTEGWMSRARRLSSGDRLVCYLAGAHRWVAVLEVTGEATFDRSEEGRIWDEDYPTRVPVRVLFSVEPIYGPRILDMLSELEMFKSLENPEKSWGSKFLSSLNGVTDRDGHAIEAALQDAAQRRVPHELPASAFRQAPPRVIESSDGLEIVIPEDPEPAEGGTTPEAGTIHTRVQGILARMGSAMGLSVYIPPNDRRKTWNGIEVGDVPTAVTDLGLSWAESPIDTVKHIDVLWLEPRSVVAAFEVESTTSVFSGLLRMADLTSELPNLDVKCFIVAPDDRRDKVSDEIRRPTFMHLRQPLKNYCYFIPFSKVLAAEEESRDMWPLIGPKAVDYLTSHLVVDI